ncbi:hypothetical protein A2W24_05815 [Microgenomates group bacterium RBG_16_45_19]|nr:MAG: hypothetical protein A2W24_05815 [Microgenomates group bacterium RBG_16_45_19]
MSRQLHRQRLGLILALVVLIGVGFISWRWLAGSPPSSGAAPTPTPTLPVNLIPISQRPYLSLQPLPGRNELSLTLFSLPLEAASVEVSLEYDRNRGVWDAVFKSIALANLPLVEKLFLGNKSAGGHITYHDDVVGGTLTLSFTGGAEPYKLAVPWRYDDSASKYRQFATQDAKFQAESPIPIKATKVIVMQSPGLPAPLEGQILAGPYLIRLPGPWPKTNLNLTIRLAEVSPATQLYGWDGLSWQHIASQLNDKTLTAVSPYYQAWVVVSPSP